MMHPHNRLWSLWEMLELNVGKFVRNITYLSGFAWLLKSDESPDAVILEETRVIYLEACENLGDNLDDLDLKATDRALGRLVGNLETNEDLNFGVFKSLVEDLMLRMEDELEFTKFLAIESAKIRFYEPDVPLFGALVAANYPSAYFEIEEAGKCLALNRSTACVFHLMRSMEVGIRAVASGLKIPDPIKPADRNWGNILRKIKEEIDQKERWRRKADKVFFEEAHASLDAVRNPWRNATMHVERTYTEEEAENIFYVVRAFMMKISSRIDERGKFVSQTS